MEGSYGNANVRGQADGTSSVVLGVQLHHSHNMVGSTVLHNLFST